MSAEVPPDHLADAVVGVATVAARTCGVLDQCGGAADLERLVADLDVAARDAQSVAESQSGGEPDASYDELFRQARAADAWRQSATVSSMATASDSVYEAVHALGGDASAEARIVDLLNT
ncbi:MAG TPA: hypothetical protein VGO78_17785 [Acidimicrobiales bacterium]|nr:hypothetical protein [Acidimicrobiales bacterium]